MRTEAGTAERLALYGTLEPEPEVRLLEAGPLTAEFVAGNLRDIRFDGVEAIRAIGYIVRDKDWGTYAPEISNVRVTEERNAFQLSYDARCQAPDGSILVFSASISGRAEGLLLFDVRATPVGGFVTNRCGFCVLHPIVGVAGSPVIVEHVDGARVTATMPDLIDPWQPFKQMRAITHQPRKGMKATCLMEGDAFEMEDQRNWSDASYKTYVRPLELPWPYLLPDGRPIIQSVSLTCEGAVMSAPAPRSEENIEIALGDEIGPAPKIGLIVTPEETAAVLAQLERLSEIGPQLLTCHFDPTAGHGREALAGFAALAASTRAEFTLECVVPGRESPAVELAAIAAMAQEAGFRPDAVIVSPAVDRQSTPPGSAWPECPPLAEFYSAARMAFPGVRLGGGSLSYFTELNRKRPPVELLDFVTHATCPIVHAADDRSVMQTLEALPFITRSARAFIGLAKPYRIGPSTIAMRQNPYGSHTFDNSGGKRLAMANADPRHSAQFAAAWTLGYAARTAPARLEALTPAALTGSFGLFDSYGARRPLYTAVRALASMAGRPLRQVSCNSPEKIQGLAASLDGVATIWLANLTDQSLRVGLAGAANMIELAPYNIRVIGDGR